MGTGAIVQLHVIGIGVVLNIGGYDVMIDAVTQLLFDNISKVKELLPQNVNYGGSMR